MYKICLVEDEVNLNNIVKTYLENAGYEVISFYDGKSALAYIGNEVNLWILDIMLGDDVSGYDIIKKMRENNDQTPVIFTSARDQELDKIIGLELGSDDYVTKPYSPKQLVLRVNNIIKRVYTKVTTKTYYETYEIDTERRIILENNQEIPLTTLEYDLVLFFINNKNKSFGREEILKNVWGTDYFGNDRVVDDLIRRVRKKLPKLNINTLYGFGYRLSWNIPN